LTKVTIKICTKTSIFILFLFIFLFIFLFYFILFFWVVVVVVVVTSAGWDLILIISDDFNLFSIFQNQRTRVDSGCFQKTSKNQ